MDNTPYDDVFRTLLTDCTELIIPVVNEIFHTKYTRKEKICLLQNEHFIKLPDGSMIIQMFEYDTQLALENKEMTADTLTVRFPDSAIVSLRHSKNTPEVMTVKVQTPGGRISYTVPVLKVKRYTINELFEKKLFFLIPFHIFAYEKDFKELEENNKKLKQLEAEYASIRERLEIACQMGDLTEYPKVAILNMSHKVIEHLAVKYQKVAKGVSRKMGGKVLEYEAKDILNRGRMEEKFQLAAKLLKSGSSVEYVAELTELPQEAVLELAQTLQSEQ